MNNDTLQSLCRGYLSRLRDVASKYGLGDWVDIKIKANVKGECSGTQEEVEMLSRLCDEERIERSEIPAILGKSYRKCFEEDDFAHIKKLRHVGIYSKVSTMLYKEKQEKEQHDKEL